MRKRLWPLCLLSLLALMSVSGVHAAGQTIKVYPIAAGTAATVTPATELKRANQPLLVGVKVAPPFVIEDHGHYSGLAIDLWQEIAADHGWKYVYRPYDLDGLLQAVSDSKVDVALGAITATAAREQRMDFAHPITSSGLAVAVRGGQTAGWLAVARALVSPAFLKVIGSLTLLLLVVGFLVWLLEHKRNPEQFGGSRRQGIFSGFWWAMVTMTTVGYGDTAPRTVGGRIIGLVWMLAALLIVSFFTAAITSALTVGQLSEHAHRQRAGQHQRQLARPRAIRLRQGPRRRCRAGGAGRRPRRRRGLRRTPVALEHPPALPRSAEGAATAAGAAGLCFRPAHRQPPARTDRHLAAAADQRAGLAAAAGQGLRRDRPVNGPTRGANPFGRPYG
jgi:ABC-type amino acid transport substrate-binding protein